MDNGLYALSPPDHTLLLAALATAFPFTSRWPSSLFLHLCCPALDCLNSQTHSCPHLCSTFRASRHYSFLSSCCTPALKYFTPSLILPLLFVISPLHIQPRPGAYFLQCLSALLHSSRLHLVILQDYEYDKQTETCLEMRVKSYTAKKQDLTENICLISRQFLTSGTVYQNLF